MDSVNTHGGGNSDAGLMSVLRLYMATYCYVGLKDSLEYQLRNITKHWDGQIFLNCEIVAEMYRQDKPGNVKTVAVAILYELKECKGR